MAVSFVDCREDQLPALQSFFARVYRPDYVLAVNADYFRWQFGNTPVSKSDGYHMRLALVDGEITGCLGYIPLEISVGGRVVTGAWLANWMVDPNTRQFGLGPLLVREISKQFEITLAAGPNKDARDLLARMGWTDFGELPRYVAVLDAGAAGALAESGKLEWPEDALGQAAKRAGEAAAGLVSRPSPDSTELWDRVCGAACAGTRRSEAFLAWRYVEHSAFSHRLFEARRDGRLAASAVYRVEQVRNSPVKVGRILELVSEEGAEADILGAVLDDARSQGCAAIDFFCSSSRIAGAMSRHGFLPGESDTGKQIPVLFQPIDRRRSGIVVMADLKKAPDAAAIKDWYFTKSDGDQDRPN